MRALLLLLALCGAHLLPAEAWAGWDPLQKAKRSALEGARRLAEGDSLGAVEAMLKAQALAPDDPRIRMGLAETLYNNGEYKSSLGQYELAGDGSEEYRPDALYNAGNAAFASGDLKRALDLYTRALAAGDADPDLLHNLELAQTLLDQAEQQQEQGEDGEPQEGEDGEQQEEQGSQEQQQEQQQQQQEQEQQPEQEEGQPQEREGEGEEQEQEQEPQPAQPDSLPPMPAMADSLAIPEGMTPEQAMRLLDALDHDEEELRRSIQRRLRRGEKESENDW